MPGRNFDGQGLRRPVNDTLRGAISQNRDLKVFVAAGYYDFATPYFAAEYTFNHLGLDPSLNKNIRLEHYGKTLHVAPDYDHAAEDHIGDWFEQFYSIRFRNYPVGREYLHEAEQIACG